MWPIFFRDIDADEDLTFYFKDFYEYSVLFRGRDCEC